MKIHEKFNQKQQENTGVFFIEFDSTGGIKNIFAFDLIVPQKILLNATNLFPSGVGIIFET